VRVHEVCGGGAGGEGWACLSVWPASDDNDGIRPPARSRRTDFVVFACRMSNTRHHPGRCWQRATRQPLSAWTCFPPSETSGQLVRASSPPSKRLQRRTRPIASYTGGQPFRLCREVTTTCHTFAKVHHLGTGRSWTWNRATRGSSVFCPSAVGLHPHRILLVLFRRRSTSATLVSDPQFPRPATPSVSPKSHRQTEQLIPAIITFIESRLAITRAGELDDQTNPFPISLDIPLRFQISLERDAGYVHFCLGCPLAPIPCVTGVADATHPFLAGRLGPNDL
jgi:hypothetical protein